MTLSFLSGSFPCGNAQPGRRGGAAGPVIRGAYAENGFGAGPVVSLFLMLVLLPACSMALPACGTGNSTGTGEGAALSPDVVKLEVAGKEIVLELALTDAERARGLMYRKELEPDSGMLFVYPGQRLLSFWMKDTWIPLSIAFVRRDGLVTNIEEMRPLLTEKRYESNEPCRYAIEMNSGWFGRHGVEAGDYIVITDEIESLNVD
jgi:uncharacterized protein